MKYIFQLFINGTKQTSNFKLWGYNTTNPSELIANVSLNGSFIPQTDIILFLVWEKFETGTPLDITNITIQIEEGYVVTSYEPYKSSILSTSNKVVLRSLPNGVCDTLNVLTGEYTQRIGDITFDGSDNRWQKLIYPPHNNDTHYQFKYWLGDNLIGGDLWGSAKDILANNLPSMDGTLHWGGKGNYGIGGDRSNFMITWEKSSCPFYDISTLNAWLQQNPIIVQYQLAEPIITTIDLSVVDQDGNVIPKVKSYKDVTHLEVTVPKQSLLPNISAEVATDNSKDMSLLTTKHQEISETQSVIQDNIQSQSDEIDTALMATTEIFESILE